MRAAWRSITRAVKCPLVSSTPHACPCPCPCPDEVNRFLRKGGPARRSVRYRTISSVQGPGRWQGQWSEHDRPGYRRSRTKPQRVVAGFARDHQNGLAGGDEAQCDAGRQFDSELVRIIPVGQEQLAHRSSPCGVDAPREHELLALEIEVHFGRLS